MKEVDAAKWFGEDVGEVVFAAYTKDSNIAEGNVIADSVELNSDVFHFGVEDLVLCQAGHRVIVAMYWGASVARKGETIQ